MKNFINNFFLIVLLISCSKDDGSQIPDEILSDQNTISSFRLNINSEVIEGSIDQNTKIITFNVVDANLISLIPSIEFSDKASISPAQNVPQNFENEITYTITAENGDKAIYRVIVNNRPLENGSSILTFSVNIDNQTVEGTVDESNRTISFNAGNFDKTALIPTITLSENSTVSPQSGLQQNFENILTYTVTAENGNVSEYKVIANKPTFDQNGVWTTGGQFTNNPVLLYTNANLRLFGNFLTFDRPNTTLYLFDGTNKFQLPLLSDDIRSENGLVIEYNLYTKIPDNIPDNANYKLIYEVEGIVTEAQTSIDITSINAPLPQNLNQDLYRLNDVLVISGENITDMIAIPANGSVFLIENSNNYDYMVNTERTEASVTLDFSTLFFAPKEKVITLLDSNTRRAGEAIIANFE